MYFWVLLYWKYLCMCSISRISPSWARAGCKKTLCLLHYPRKIKFIQSFIHSFIHSLITRKISALRWAAIGAVLLFHYLWGTKSQDSVHKPQPFWREKRASSLGQTSSRKTKTKQKNSELVECCFTSTETVGLLGTGRLGLPPRLSHSSWALKFREREREWMNE